MDKLLLISLVFAFVLGSQSRQRKYYYATTDPNRPFSCANIELRYFGQRRGTPPLKKLDRLCCRGRNDTCIVALSQQQKLLTNWNNGKEFWWWTPPKYFSDLRDGICYCDEDCQAAYKTYYNGKPDLVSSDCCPDFRTVCKRP